MEFGQTISNAKQQGMSGGIAGSRNATPDLNGESLSSVAPRVIQLAHQISQYANKVNASFGIGIPESAEVPPTAPNLMSQLLEVERHLRFTAYALETALQHING